MTVSAFLEVSADGPSTDEPSVVAARMQLLRRVRALLLEHGPMDSTRLAAMAGASTAHVMFAVRELEKLGLAVTELPTD